MDTKIQQTSLDAYHSLKVSKVKKQYQIILNKLIELREANNMMLSKYTLLPINVICARMYELRTKGHIESIGTKPCPFTKKKTQFWAVKQ